MLLRSVFLALFILSFSVNPLYSQSAGWFSHLSASRYAESVRLSGAYSALARGPAAVQYNTAGLAAQEGFSMVYSEGQGFAMLSTEIRDAFDIAIVGQVPAWNSAFAISYSKLPATRHWQGSTGNDAGQLEFKFEPQMFRIHGAIQIVEELACGISINYYEDSQFRDEYAYDRNQPIFEIIQLFDMSLSIHGRIQDLFAENNSDEMRFGLSAQNILGTDVLVSNDSRYGPLYDQLFQTLRGGISYSRILNLEKVENLHPLQIVAAVEASVHGAEYDYEDFYYSAALEATVFEFLMVSAGIEDSKDITGWNWHRGEYPVFRYGFGFIVPLGKLLNLQQRIDFQFDYARSEWNVEDLFSWYTEYIDPVAWSMSARVVF